MNFSTFQPFNLSTSQLALALAAALCSAATTTALADSASDSAIRMNEVGLSVFGHEDFETPQAVYPTAASGTIAGVTNSAQSTTSATTCWSLSAWSVGRMVSEQPPNAEVGEFLTDFPCAESEIDWEKTLAAIRASQASSNGYIAVISGTTNRCETLLITRSGSMVIPFVRTDGTEVSSFYTFSAATDARPYRLFATRREEGNNAPLIDLSGRFVRFFGNPAIITPRYAITSAGTSNVVWGIDYDPSSSHMLTARYIVDEASGAIDCPKGQFVLAYYDTETKERLVASIVVEITPPSVNTLQATVGSELRPVGGGWDVADLQGVVKDGVDVDSTDPYSPYVERFSAPSGQELSNEYHGKIYAIAPTDKSTSGALNMAMPWKVDIYWKMSDPMGVMWTFENDWYLISWPENTYRLVISDAPSKPGLEWAIPTNYTAQILGYKAPNSLVAKLDSSSGEVTVKGEGKFLVKILTDALDMPWYLPMQSRYRTNPEVLASTSAGAIVADWPIGVEATMFTGDAAGTAANAAKLMDTSLPGYIYEAASTGRNWNPRLYHEPEPDGVNNAGDDARSSVESAGGTETKDDPFEDLVSAIYGVNESLNPVEVWWRGNIMLEGMTTPITYPGLVERYRFTWDETLRKGLVPDIVLSSKLGSADPTMTAFGGRSLVFLGKDAYASLNDSVPLPGLTNVVSFQVYSSDFAFETATGRVVTVTSGGDIFAISLSSASFTNLVFSSSVNGVPRTVIDLKRDGWADVAFELPEEMRDGKATLLLGKAGGERAAGGFELDDISIRCIDAMGTNDEDTVRFLFSSTDLEPTPGDSSVRTAADVSGHGYQLVANGFNISERGSPRKFNGKISADSHAEIYCQNDPDAVGWNPNEEHAFVKLDGDYVVWAMRNDLNTDKSSKSVVLAQYAKDGKGAMQAYRVVTTSPAYPAFTNTVIAGSRMIIPGPIGKLEGSEASYNAYSSLYSFDDANVVYRDRKGAAWARRDGAAMARYSYLIQDGFYCPSLGDKQLAVGTAVGWMNCVNIKNPSEANLTDLAGSIPWNWHSVWPATNAVPTMKVGQVLTKATAGLPEVWNAASMAISYPNPAASPGKSVATVVDLIDPTVAQHAPLAIDGDFAGEYGFTTGSSGTCFLRKGKYYFSRLPPSIADRFYIDTNASVSNRMNLVGQLVEKESGGSYLELNVLTEAEREALKKICPESADKKSAWDAAVDVLAEKAVIPSTRNSTAPFEIECRSYFNYVFPSEWAYEKWLAHIASNAVPVIASSGDYCAVTSTNGPAYVNDVLTPVAAISSPLTVNWSRLHMPTKQEAAKRYYELSGLAEMIGEWEDLRDRSVLGNLLPWVDAHYVSGYFHWTATSAMPSTSYAPQDHYALVANGSGSGWVTLVENDNDDKSMVNPGLPVSMHVIRVEPELYLDGIAVLTDPLNKLSERLTLLYRTPLGNAAGDYEFEWKYATPNADGTLSPDKESAAWTDKTVPAVKAGLVSLQLGEDSTVQDFVNTYYTMRYRAKEGTLAAQTVGTGWSGWTDEQLAEGWVQRVLNSVTPFAQRVEDFYSNPSDVAFTMLEQIGRPYQGDVALNNDNLTQVGLLELYQTIFNKAESILVAAGGGNVDLSKQLILAASRMGEFYSLLGAEAYSDAKNPLIASAEDAPTAAGVFCFANQVPTLLDEELALLRGRTSSTQFPKLTAAPYFNRLLWNFTKGITEGEVAYVSNYGIRARDGVMDVNCAAAQYPQGHGDAWGHYLSVLKGYYRLLRNPYVAWTASMTEMLMDQTTVNVDYQDEAKFADAAVKLAQVGLDAMSLTARKAYKENSGDIRSGYFDADETEAFGYGEWATRTGMGAAYNWMVANAMTPSTNESAAVFRDLGLKRIDREQNGAQMKALCQTVANLQITLGGLEGGLNPLGLSENTIPFDIDPDALAEKNSHFEQILERAEKSLANCKTVLDWANVYGARLAQLQKNETETIDDIATQELAYKNQLIAIYGTPFAGDIGPGGTYPQGYEGPDIYNYNYMDLSVFGLEDGLETVFTNSYPLYEAGLSGYWIQKMQTGYREDVDLAVTVNYIVSDGGIRVKPDTVTGVRATEGTIQSAYRNYIDAYQKLQNAMSDYQVKIVVMQETWKQTVEARARLGVTMGLQMAPLVYGMLGINADVAHYVDLLTLDFNLKSRIGIVTEGTIPSVLGAGTTVVTSPQSVANAAKANLEVSSLFNTYLQLRTAKEIAYTTGYKSELIQSGVDMVGQAWDIADSMRSLKSAMESAANEVNAAASEIQDVLAKLTNAEAAYRAEIYKGEMLQEERRLWRQQVSNEATQQRYLDMFNRVQRNNALVKYSTAFDTAQRYVFELAKVYDYETGLLSSDPQSGRQFLADIVATRSLGSEGLATSSGTTDGGLWDVVTRMKANWAVLKGRLGINNPDKPEKWFSLRYELFRIKPDSSGDAAWSRELRKYWVDDIRVDSDFVRYCQPLESEAVVVKEPGLIIPFSTSINNAENFFGRTLQGGESQFSSADYATKIAAVGVCFDGYDSLTTKTTSGLATEPNIYLVPVGTDYMRAPAGTTRKVLGWNVVDQVMPLPYAIGSTQLDDEGWISTMSGLDGTSDSAATIRRHSTLRAGNAFTSTRLVGRSVWNDRWLLVIPASSLNADRTKALETFVNGIDDIKIGIKAYSRSGN